MDLLAIHLWDVRTERIQPYRAEPVSGVCVVDGRIWYMQRRGSERVVFEGSHGEEKERPVVPRRTASGDPGSPPSVKRFTCKEYWYTELPRPNGGTVHVLKPEHGLLEYVGTRFLEGQGNKVPMPPFRVWVHRDGKSTELPFPYERMTQDFLSLPIAYSKMDGGYLLRKEQRGFAGRMVNRFFLAHGANVKLKNGGRGNAVSSAASGGHRAIVEWLVERGAEVNPYKRDGEAEQGLALPLYAAVYGSRFTRDTEMIRFLVRKGANPNIRAKDGDSALSYAKRRGLTEVAEILVAGRAREGAVAR